MIEIQRSDIAALHHDMRSTPYQNDCTLGVLSKTFNMTEVWVFAPTARFPACTSSSSRRRSGSGS